MTTTFSITRAALDDVPNLVPLYERFFAEDAITVARPEIEANLRQMLADDRAAVFVAMAGGEAVGLASGSLTCGVEFGWAAEMEDLFVVPESRGQGLARRLVEVTLAWADERGARQTLLVITPEAEEAQSLTALYAKFGFVRSDRVLMYRTQ
ncbi:GNAT family N-acetyltransferase [Salipiger bermudensis]|uniref:GNAT family N-acetyltransferase n=1 Tax=Salipiger bermudensis TaxID=344736 RepID=UPI001CD48309|nr:GNAT family N-acetyltransferase [Salipiger bermudensis]MCA0962481.1 GNAT family N-acetyltransferase [Salipiger bermudensis]